MSGTFYRTYRPQKFGELVGQVIIRKSLAQAVLDQRIAHAYLFTGPRGTGKTTTARILAKAINCLADLSERPQGEPCNTCRSCLAINENKTLDLVEIDAASYTGVDNIRQLTENIELSPASLFYRVFIIDEVHMLSRGAFNALLKTLEEPPPHTVFILATTEQHKVPLTITSRCQRFSFRLLTLPEILQKLKTIAKKEDIDIDEESLEAISETASGGMRDAESLFAQVATLFGKKVKYSETREILGIAGREDELQLLELVFKKETSETLNILDKLTKEGLDTFLLSHRLLDYLRKILLLKVNAKGAKIISREISERQVEKLSKLSKEVTAAELISLMAKIVQAQPQIKNSSFPYLPLELVIAEWGLDKSAQQAVEGERPGKVNASKNNNNIVIPSEAQRVEESPVQSHESTIGSLKDPSAEFTPAKAGALDDNINNKKAKTATRKLGNSKTKKETEKVLTKKRDKTDLTPTNLKTVLSQWTAVLQNIRDVQPALFSLLKVCSPVRVEDETLVIATPFKFHKDKLNDGRNKAIFCQELDKVIGLRRICVIEDKAVGNGKVKEKEMLEQVKDLLG